MQKGFTLIEMLIVMAIIALLASIAYPRYDHALEKAKLVVLENNLHALRDAIDHYENDIGQYPSTLSDLVTRGYLRAIPTDPITRKTTWETVPVNHTNPDSIIVAAVPDPSDAGIYDVHSLATGVSFENKAFSSY